MENIIQQIALELVEKITKKAFEAKFFDIDALASDVLGDCKTAARSILQVIVAQLNEAVRNDKTMRKELGLVLKEKNRKRELLTEIGVLNLQRDYYFDKEYEHYTFPLDIFLSIGRYERISDNVSARLVSEATDVSYAKSAQIVAGGTVSRQSVRNQILKLSVPEKEPAWTEKKKAKELHVYADEDHVHLQKPGKESGKKGKNVPLVTVTEGTESEGTRRKTVCPMHFVNEQFDTAALWCSVEGYIHKAYELESLEKIYVHADGGQWIRKGLKDFVQTEHVLDGFHLEKYLRQIQAGFPKKNLRNRFHRAFENNDRNKADRIMQELYAEAEGDGKQTKLVRKFGSYIMNNWEEIVRRETLDIPGSCTEGQVSHVLSERFSRDPLGWSEESLGKLSQARVYLKNGGRLTGEDFKAEEYGEGRKEKYGTYAERMMKETIEGCFDWSIFEKPIIPMDKASGTQFLIESIGERRNILYS